MLHHYICIFGVESMLYHTLLQIDMLISTFDSIGYVMQSHSIILCSKSVMLFIFCMFLHMWQECKVTLIHQACIYIWIHSHYLFYILFREYCIFFRVLECLKGTYTSIPYSYISFAFCFLVTM